MSNFQIHELNSVPVNRNSNIIHDTEVSTDEWDTGKNTAGAVADLASANVAAPYDTTVTYAIGQYCLYEGNIYRCIAITTGAFDSTAWIQIVVTGEFRRVVELTSADYAQLTPAEQNNGTLYVLTDEVTTAADIPYNNTTSGLTADDLQEAVDEVNGKVLTVHTKTVSIAFDSTGEGAVSDTDIDHIIAVEDMMSDSGVYPAYFAYKARGNSWRIKTLNRNSLGYTSQGLISSTRTVKIYYLA